MARDLTAGKRPNMSADQLIDATASLLSERSTLDVSLNEIAKSSGLNSALIKYYFGNKEGLFLALLERDAKLAMTALEDLVAMNVSADQKLRIHISGMINAYYRAPYLNRLIHFMVESASEEASKRVAGLFIEPMLVAYRRIIDQGIKEGILDPVDPAMLYYSIVGACDHMFHASYSVPATLGATRITEAVKAQYITHVTKVMLNGLVAKSVSTD